MKELLKDVLEIEGVNGIVILTDEGDVIFKDILSDTLTKIDELEWGLFIGDIGGSREAELVYEQGLFYVRKVEFGYMIVIVDLHVQTAMIRLNCDIVLPSLQDLKTSKKYKKLFKK
jgi:hypothetical protein